MPSISPGGGLETLDTQVSALSATLTSLQTQMTTLQADLVTAQAVVATLSTSGNYYTKTEANALLAAKAAATHTHVVNDIANATTLGKALMVLATEAAGRTALGLGGIAVMEASAFASSTAIADHNASPTAHPDMISSSADLMERIQDVINSTIVTAPVGGGGDTLTKSYNDGTGVLTITFTPAGGGP